MAKANTSSVDTGKGDKIAARGNQYKAAQKAGFNPKETNEKEQIINAKKGVNLTAKKEKAKKKAKLAKASKKKNKK